MVGEDNSGVMLCKRPLPPFVLHLNEYNTEYTSQNSKCTSRKSKSPSRASIRHVYIAVRLFTSFRAVSAINKVFV